MKIRFIRRYYFSSKNLIFFLEIIFSCNLNIRPEFKTAINACLLFDPKERPTVSKLLNFSFSLLVNNLSSRSMHYKRTSASQTPKIRNIGKTFDTKKYLSKRNKGPLGISSNTLKLNGSVQNSTNIISKNIKSFKSNLIHSDTRKEIKNSIGGISTYKKTKEPIERNMILNSQNSRIEKRDLSPATRKYLESRATKQNNEGPRRWKKIMKSVDLKAKQNTYPRQERIRIIKSPPPNVS